MKKEAAQPNAKIVQSETETSIAHRPSTLEFSIEAKTTQF